MASLKDLCLTTLEDHGDEYDLRELCDIRGCSYIMSSLFGVSEHPQWCCKNLVSICPLGSAFCQHFCWPCLAIAADKICEHPLRLCAKNSGVSNKKKLKAWDHRILDMFKKVRHAYSCNNTTMADVTPDLELWITTYLMLTICSD